MGYIRHHAIVVTGMDEWTGFKTEALATIHDAHAAALAAGCAVVTPVAGPGVNGYSSFLVAPDGSKEGWDDSDSGDAARGRFIAWLRDANGYFSWAEVVLGSDDQEAVIERNAWDSVDA